MLSLILDSIGFYGNFIISYFIRYLYIMFVVFVDIFK